MDAGDKEARRYKMAMIGRELTALCMRNEPHRARAAFDEAEADVRASITSGFETPDSWLRCLRGCNAI